MTMRIRTTATAIVITLIAGACGSGGDVKVGADAEAASDESETQTLVTSPPFGEVWGESLEEVAAQLELVVLVRATDHAWTDFPPGSAGSRGGLSEEDRELAEEGPMYHWREFEVVEVLSGSYDHDTVSYGNLLWRTHADETYMLMINVLLDEAGEPRYSAQHFTGPVPPYLLTAENILTNTEPDATPELDATLTLSEARVRLGDANNQSGTTEVPELPTPLPSLEEEQGD